MNKVYLFGSGNNAYGVISYIGEQNVIAIIDNEKKKQGDFLQGIPIISFDRFLEGYLGEEIVITVAMYEEIVSQLINNNLFNYSIAPLVIMGLANPKEIFEECQIKEKESIYLLGRNVITQKFCDWIKNQNIDIKIFLVEIGEKKYSDLIATTVDYKDIPDDATIIIFEEKLDESARLYFDKFNRVYDIYKIKNNKLKEQCNKIKKYRNLHIGEKCFFVGNGPSLRLEDLEQINNLRVKSFGFNLIYNIYPDTLWRPDYYVVTEYSIYRNYYKELSKLDNGDIFIKSFFPINNIPDLDNVNYYPGYARRTYLENQQFSDNIAEVVYAGYSVMFDAMQIAMYMGFKEIFLIGADFNYLNNTLAKGNHIYDYNTKDKRKVAGKAYMNVTAEAFKCAKKFADLHGIKIYNATRGGKLEIFERKNLDKLFLEIEDENM